MKITFLKFFFIFVNFYYILGAKNEQCGVVNFNKTILANDLLSPIRRLIGGRISKPHSWPWNGQLLFNRKFKCGCVLFNPNFVLTAAHCLDFSQQTFKYTVKLGGHQIYTGKTYFVKQIKFHPLYKSDSLDFDIAILKISPKVENNSKISTICLPLLDVPMRKICVVTGWGRMSEKGPTQDFLNEIYVPVIPSTSCINITLYKSIFRSSRMFCAGFETGKIDACYGDSGGPLQCLNEKGFWELQGIVSWGIGCGEPGYPGVYTRVFTLKYWIQKELRSFEEQKFFHFN